MRTSNAAGTFARTVLAVVGLRREARLLTDPTVRVVIGGGDCESLKAKLQQALASDPINGVISVGLGGALSPELQVGDWIVADRVMAGGDVWLTDASWSTALQAGLIQAARTAQGRVHIGPIAGSDVMVADAKAKAALHNAVGALVVDMESHIVARFASAHGLPFAALRVISDGADRALPKAAQAGMKPDGGMDIIAVLKALACDPRQLPALIRTGREAEIAFRALALLGRHDLLGRARVGQLDFGELRLDVT